VFLLETGDTGLRVDAGPVAGREDDRAVGADFLSLPLNQPISLYVLLYKTNKILLHEKNNVVPVEKPFTK
jgi:hypothetical protein